MVVKGESWNWEVLLIFSLVSSIQSNQSKCPMRKRGLEREVNVLRSSFKV